MIYSTMLVIPMGYPQWLVNLYSLIHIKPSPFHPAEPWPRGPQSIAVPEAKQKRSAALRRPVGVAPCSLSLSLFRW